MTIGQPFNRTEEYQDAAPVHVLILNSIRMYLRLMLRLGKFGAQISRSLGMIKSDPS
jgi:hypothetical protein